MLSFKAITAISDYINTKGGEDMTKEKLTIDAIRQDLKRIAAWSISNKAGWRFSFIIPITLLAVLMGILLRNPWIGILIFLVALYHIIRYVIAYHEYKAKKRAVLEILDRADISISVERFSHIAVETVYEPHSGGSGNSAKAVKVFCFQSFANWRVPPFDRHYKWSKEFDISTKGLENISIKGDDFFYVSLQEHPDIAYIYPCKNFDLDSSLMKQL